MNEKMFADVVKQIEKQLRGKRTFTQFINSLVPTLGEMEYDEGVYRNIAIFDEVVIKRQEYRSTANQREAENVAIFKQIKSLTSYFPHTTLLKNPKFNGLLVQERVPCHAPGVVFDFADLKDDVSGLAIALGINDCHSGNFGFREDGSIVIFDVHASISAEYDESISSPDISGVCIIPSLRKAHERRRKLEKHLTRIRPKLKNKIQEYLAA